MYRRCILLLGCVCSFLVAAAHAGDWPQFRGPNGTGVAEDTKLPDTWAQDKNVQWKVALPGVGWSSPIISGDKVFVTTAVSEKQVKPMPQQGGRRPGGGGGRPGGFGRGRNQPPDAVYRWEVYCFDRTTGKELWKTLALERKPTIPSHRTNGYASETPVTDGERVYAYFGMTGLFCFDLSGKLLWKKDLESFPMMAGWGTGSSPVLEGDRLFVQCDNEERSFLAAFDKKTGQELWRVPRDERSGWATPYIWRNQKRTELVAGGGRKVRSYDPATGKVLWELGGVAGRCAASPVGDAERLYVGTGGGRGGRRFGGGDEDGEGMGASGPLFAIRAGAAGDLTLKEGATSNEGVAWFQAKGGPSMASPLVYQGLLYILDQRGGMLSCYDAKTGKPVYTRERLSGARSFTSSPWACDGKVFCLDDGGQTFIIQAGPTFKVLGKNTINEMCWATPAVAAGALFLRGGDHLYCIKP